jgi:hypothetical protein
MQGFCNAYNYLEFKVVQRAFEALCANKEENREWTVTFDCIGYHRLTKIRRITLLV